MTQERDPKEEASVGGASALCGIDCDRNIAKIKAVLATSRIVYVAVETTEDSASFSEPSRCCTIVTMGGYRGILRRWCQNATAKTVDIDTEKKVAELSSRTNTNGNCSEKQVNVTLFPPPEELLPSVDNLAEIDHGFQLRRPRSQPA